MINAKELKEISDNAVDKISEEIGQVLSKCYPDLEKSLKAAASKGLYRLQFWLENYIPNNIKDLARSKDVFEIFSQMMAEEGYTTKYSTYTYIEISW